MKLAAAFSIWVAYASRVLVAVSRRNYLSFCCARESAFVFRKVRDGGTPSHISSTRNACATQNNKHAGA
jgi:hypothetical protein